MGVEITMLKGRVIPCLVSFAKNKVGGPYAYVTQFPEKVIDFIFV